MQAETYHADDKWQRGKCSTEHWSLFNEQSVDINFLYK